MKSYIISGSVVIFLVVLSILGARDALGYLRVVGEAVRDQIRSNIPIAADISRLELLLDDLESEIQNQQISLQRAQMVIPASDPCDVCMPACSEFVYLDCHRVTDRAPTIGHFRYRGEPLASRPGNQVFASRHPTYRSLAERVSELQLQRTQLTKRMEELRTRNAAQQAARRDETSALARATALSDQIDQRLNVLEREASLKERLNRDLIQLDAKDEPGVSKSAASSSEQP